MSDAIDKDSKRRGSRGNGEMSGITDSQDSVSAENPKTIQTPTAEKSRESSAVEKVIKPKTTSQSSARERHGSSTEKDVKTKTSNQSATSSNQKAGLADVHAISANQQAGFSDVQHCSPCSREGRSVEATKFCKDCDEFLCEKCVHDHRKFVVTRDHKITIKPTVVASPRQKSKLTEKCTNHEGKVIELFCSDHDELCCSVCVAVAHRGCKDVTYIPEAAVGIESSLELLEAKENILKIKDQVDELRMKREENQTVVLQQKEDIVTDILDLRIRVSEVLDKLEKTARLELQERYGEVSNKIDNDVKTCEDVSLSLANMTTKLETTVFNDPELFVQVKKAKKTIDEAKMVIKNISKNLGKEKLTFSQDRTLETLLNHLDSLGKFGEDRHAYKAQFGGEYSMAMSSDIGSSEDNPGALCLADGRVLMTNVHHKRLKMVNNHFKVVDHVDLPGKPYDVCLANENEVIVSLREEKVLQFVTIDKKLKLTRTMKIGVSCYGVACNAGELFVACVAGQYENRPQIRVYNMSGRMLRVFERTQNDEFIFSTPRNIAISPDGTLLHVTDRENGVITLDRVDGILLTVYRNSDLDSPRGIATDSDGNIFVCGQNSHNVIQLSPEGDKVSDVLVRDKARLYRPQALCLIQKQHGSMILLTFLKSKFFKVYSLA